MIGDSIQCFVSGSNFEKYRNYETQSLKIMHEIVLSDSGIPALHGKIQEMKMSLSYMTDPNYRHPKEKSKSRKGVK